MRSFLIFLTLSLFACDTEAPTAKVKEINRSSSSDVAKPVVDPNAWMNNCTFVQPITEDTVEMWREDLEAPMTSSYYSEFDGKKITTTHSPIIKRGEKITVNNVLSYLNSEGIKQDQVCWNCYMRETRQHNGIWYSTVCWNTQVEL